MHSSNVRLRLAAVPAALTGLLLAVTASAPLAAPIQWTVGSGGNGNWYEYVPAITIFAPVDFNTARNDALSRSHLGQPGYLATLTSAQEMAFVTSSFPFLLGFGATGSAWLGASDAVSEGVWRWLDGPEAGQALGFTAWSAGRPVSAPGFEDHDYLQLNINAVLQGAPPVYSWIDTSPAGAFGYVIEYGTGAISPTVVPLPPSALLLAFGVAAIGGKALSRRRRERTG